MCDTPGPSILLDCEIPSLNFCPLDMATQSFRKKGLLCDGNWQILPFQDHEAPPSAGCRRDTVDSKQGLPGQSWMMLHQSETNMHKQEFHLLIILCIYIYVIIYMYVYIFLYYVRLTGCGITSWSNGWKKGINESGQAST